MLRSWVGIAGPVILGRARRKSLPYLRFPVSPGDVYLSRHLPAEAATRHLRM